MNRTHIKLTFEDEVLGTANANPELMRDYIASKRPEGVDENEVECLPDENELLEKATTVFHRTDEGKPFIWDYWMKGFFKSACGALRSGEGRRGARATVSRDTVLRGPDRRIRT